MAGLSAGSELSVEVIVRRGSAGELHEVIPAIEDRIVVSLCRPDAPALVIGSRQSDQVWSLAGGPLGVKDIVRRRSGGGAVFVDPERSVWIDVLAPTALGRFGADVRSAMVEMGTIWRSAFVALGAAPGRLVVHAGGMETDSWGELLCFSGIGPGEVLVDGAKLVGLSQRRTRSLLRFQCQVHRVDPTDALIAMVGERPSGMPRRPALLSSVIDVEPSDEAIAEAVASAL